MTTARQQRRPRGPRGAPGPAPAAGAAPAARRAPWLELAPCLLLAAVAFALYARTGGFSFTNLDDYDYVVENPHLAGGLTAGNLAWAFSTLEREFWHPLTWLSYLADVSLFGLRAGPMHLVNAAFHAASAGLLYLALSRLSRAPWRSAGAAALFAVHPIHVESVAWISERKDVLSIFFGIVALLAYASYVRRPAPWRLAPVVAAFAASLMAKSTLVTLPFLLLLLDAWPLGRLRLRGAGGTDPAPEVPRVGWRRAVLEKLPLLALSVASAAVTVVAQLRGGSVAAGPGRLRLDNAVVSYVRYVGKLLWPSDLAVFYPLRQPAEPAGAVVVALAVLVLVTGAAVAARRRAPWFTVGWLWFVGTLVPMIGLVRVGSHAMADRYAYFPAIGLYLAASWGAWRVAQGLRGARAAPATALVALAVLAALAARTDRQVRLWADDERLFRHAVAATGPNPRARELLATVLQNRGRDEEARQELLEAVRLLPGPRTLTALAALDVKLGDEAGAERSYRAALAADPGQDEAALGLAGLLVNRGEADEGIAVLERVLARAPENPQVLSSLAVAHLDRGDAARAEQYALRAAAGGARSAGAFQVLGAVRMARGDAAGGAEALARAARLAPEDPAPRLPLAEALAGLGRAAEACEAWAFVLASPRATGEERERAAREARGAGCSPAP